jgi:hypothetical protein
MISLPPLITFACNSESTARETHPYTFRYVVQTLGSEMLSEYTKTSALSSLFRRESSYEDLATNEKATRQQGGLFFKGE